MDESTARPTEEMSDGELMAIVNGEIDRAKDYTLGPIGQERATAYDYYYGRKFGNEVEGRSQIISHDVAQQIDSAVPALIKFFAGSEKAVEFTARKAEDVIPAEQATELANYIFYTQNNGFLLLHDAIKNALLQKTACFKWYWDESVKVEETTYYQQTEDMIALLAQDPQVEIVGVNPSDVLPGSFDVKTKKKKGAGKVKVCVVPPDELLVADNAYGMEADEIPSMTHRRELTLSELVEMGYDLDTVLSLPSGTTQDYTYEAQSRNERTSDWQGRAHEIPDPMMRKVWYCETYIKVDFDRDGIAERRKICSVEGDDKPLHNEVIAEVPMSFGGCKLMPHEFYAVSMADDLMDLQLKKSSLLRNSWDNLALAITPRMGVDTTRITNLDDVMTIRMGGVIRSDGDVGGAIQPIVVPFLGQHIFPMVEYIDSEAETRTGVSRLFQGVDPNTLNKTATGVNALMNAAQARIELVARGLAETLIKPMFRGVMGLMSQHQEVAQNLTLRLRNQYVPIDPRVFATDYDMTVNVGLGTGTKDQQMAHLTNVIAMQQGMLQSPAAQMFDPRQMYQCFYNAVSKLVETAGFKDPSQFFPDPKGAQQPQPQKPPEIQKAEMQIQADKEKLGAEMQAKDKEMAFEQQSESQKMQQEAAFKQFEIEQQMRLEQFKAEQQAVLEKYKAELNARVEIEKTQIMAGAQIRSAYKEQTGEDPEDEEVKAKKQQESEQIARRDQLQEVVAQAVSQLAAKVGQPRKFKVLRGADGRAAGLASE